MSKTRAIGIGHLISEVLSRKLTNVEYRNRGHLWDLRVGGSTLKVMTSKRIDRNLNTSNGDKIDNYFTFTINNKWLKTNEIETFVFMNIDSDHTEVIKTFIVTREELISLCRNFRCNRVNKRYIQIYFDGIWRSNACDNFEQYLDNYNKIGGLL